MIDDASGESMEEDELTVVGTEESEMEYGMRLSDGAFYCPAGGKT